LAGRYDQAVTDLTAAHDLDPTAAWILTERGVAHQEAEQSDDAGA
jgi:Flp pilus assembly protein TadD